MYRALSCAVAWVSHDWYHRQSPPEHLRMKQLSQICLLLTLCAFISLFFSSQTLSSPGMMRERRRGDDNPPKTFLSNSPSAADKAFRFFFLQEEMCFFPNTAAPLLSPWCYRSLYVGDEVSSQYITTLKETAVTTDIKSILKQDETCIYPTVVKYNRNMVPLFCRFCPVSCVSWVKLFE